MTEGWSHDRVNKIVLEREQELIERALNAARDTRYLAVDQGVRHRTASIFSSVFGSQEDLIVADGNTYEAAGQDVAESFLRENRALRKPFVFGSHVYADDRSEEHT